VRVSANAVEGISQLEGALAGVCAGDGGGAEAGDQNGYMTAFS